MHYQLPYDSDAFRFAVPAPAIAAAGEGAARTFSGLAYSGEVIRNHGPWSALVLDLDGCELPPVLPVLLGHDRDRRVGLCTLAVREGVLWAEGRLLANPEAAALAADADAGLPWQLSVHAVPHHSDEIAPGLATQVNGRAQTGPLTVLRGIRIRELSFTPTGADHRTVAAVLDLTDEDSPMSTPSTDELTAQVATLSARAEAAEAALAAHQAAHQAAAPPADLIADLQGQIAALTARLEGAERTGLLLAAETNALADRLEAMVQDAVAVIPDDASVEIVEASGKTGSAEVYRELLTFCRSEVSIALLGQNQTTEADATRASALAGLEVGRDIREGDAAIVGSVIQQLIDWVVELNWPGSAPPRWRLREQEEIDEARPRRDQILVQCGVRFSRAYWLSTYGLAETDLEADQGPGPGDPAALAAPASAPAQDQIDAALDADPGYQAAMERLLAPILDALDEGLTPEEILARMDDWYPLLDDAALTDLLTRGIAAADAIGRLEVSSEQ